MTELQKKIIRFKLIESYIELMRGNADDMRVAKRLLHFLNKDEIKLDLSDEDCRVEQILSAAGVPIHYTSGFHFGYARL